MEKPSVAFDSLPSGRPLQGKMALAAHPLSYYPRRCLAVEKMREKGRKMGEKEKNGKTWREKRAESFALKFYWLSFFQQCLSWGPYSQTLLQIAKKTKAKS